MKDTSSKDLIEFIAINILFVDNFCLAIFWVYLMLILTFHYEESNVQTRILSDTIILLLIILLKIFTLILYYETDYKRVTSPLVIKFIEMLKSNVKSRCIVLFLLFIPYIPLAFSTNSYHTSTHYFWEQFFKGLCFFYLPCSGVFGYISLFLYWYVKKNIFHKEL